MSKLLSPATGTITSDYGPRKSPGGIGSTNHKGVDIARGSTRIQAPTDGTVAVSEYNIYRGNYVQIDHGNGVRTLHQHLAKRNVVKGQHVTAGQTIGTMGRTGLVTGVHLHTEVTINGIIVNPSTWYAQHGVRIAHADVGTTTVSATTATHIPAFATTPTTQEDEVKLVKPTNEGTIYEVTDFTITAITSGNDMPGLVALHGAVINLTPRDFQSVIRSRQRTGASIKEVSKA